VVCKPHSSFLAAGEIENAITAPKVVNLGQGAGQEFDARMSKHRVSLCAARTGRGEVISSTREVRRNIGASGQVEGALKTADLSATELRVLDLLRLGKTTKEIAAKLCIPEGTVTLHVRHGLRCLRARSAEELLSLIRRYH
jgi:DNA-binding NarL/FixJ family response regulator